MASAVTRYRGLVESCLCPDLGFRCAPPQALCCRPLSRASLDFFAVYAFPTVPILNTAGRPGRYTGAYGELRADWKITPHYSASVEAVHYAIGESIRQAGGHNADFLGIEFRWAW
jgi:hypothetical protein